MPLPKAPYFKNLGKLLEGTISKADLAGLPTIQELVLTLYLGLDDEEPLTLTAIANRFGTTRQAAWDAKERGLRKIARRRL